MEMEPDAGQAEEKLDRLAPAAGSVPVGIRIAAAWIWRLLLIGVAIVAIGYVMQYFSGLTIPLAVAVLLAALLTPPKAWLVRRGMPKALASALTLVVGLLLVLGVFTAIIAQIVSQGPTLASSTQAGVLQLIDWLSEGPFQLAPEQVQTGWNDVTRQIPQKLQDWSGQIAGVAAGLGSSVVAFFAGTFTALFALFFFLYNGRVLWSATLRVVPARARAAIDRGVTIGWKSLMDYVRTIIVVAAVDALGVLIGALVLQIPLAGAIAALTFVGAFVPIVGAFVAGAIGVLIALVAKGWVAALILLGVVVLVQQIEGNVLQPFLMGKAVSLHPLAILLGISLGVTLGGIAGAVVAVPILAFLKSSIESLTRREWLALAPAPDLHMSRDDIVASNTMGGGTAATLALQLDRTNRTTADVLVLRVSPVPTEDPDDGGDPDRGGSRRGDSPDPD